MIVQVSVIRKLSSIWSIMVINFVIGMAKVTKSAFCTFSGRWIHKAQYRPASAIQFLPVRIINQIGTSCTKWAITSIFGSAVKTGQVNRPERTSGVAKDDCIRLVPFFQLIPSFENDIIPWLAVWAGCPKNELPVQDTFCIALLSHPDNGRYRFGKPLAWNLCISCTAYPQYRYGRRHQTLRFATDF